MKIVKIKATVNISGEIRMYHETDRSSRKPFRVDLFEGIIQNNELYSEAKTIESGGCNIFVKMYLKRT